MECGANTIEARRERPSQGGGERQRGMMWQHACHYQHANLAEPTGCGGIRSQSGVQFPAMVCEHMQNFAQLDEVPGITQIVENSEMWVPIYTSILIGFLFVALVAFDVVVAVFVGNEATLSRAMLRISIAFPLVIVVWGGLGSHLFSPSNGRWNGWWGELKAPVLLIIGWIVFRLSFVQVITIIEK